MSENISHPSLCLYRWTYPVINFKRREFKFCCKTPPQKIDFSELKAKGSDYFNNNETIIERRKEMLSGEQHSDCASCWKIEAEQVVSFRSQATDFLNHHDSQWKEQFSSIDESLKQLNNKRDLTYSDKPKTLEISLDNTCNMKCIYCNHHFSSLWEKEAIQFGELKPSEVQNLSHAENDFLKEKFWIWFEDKALASLDTISILGGEPLLMDDFYEFVEKLLLIAKKHKVKKNRIGLSIVTNFNLNSRQLDKFIEIIPKLNEIFTVQIRLSMDSTSERAEYIRYGLNWDRWERNVDKLLDLELNNTSVTFFVAISCLNITSLKDYLFFLYQKQKKYKPSLLIQEIIVTQPEVHSYLNLPACFAVYLQEAIDFLNEIEHEMFNSDSTRGAWKVFKNQLITLHKSLKNNKITKQQMKNFHQWFSRNDKRRGSSLIKTFPELSDFWYECQATVWHEPL